MAENVTSLWKLSQKRRDCFAILFVWTLFVSFFDLLPKSAAPGLTLLLILLHLFLEPTAMLLVAGRLLQARMAPGQTGWKPVFQATSRLYLRAFFICFLLVVANIVLQSTFSPVSKTELSLLERWKITSLTLPLSLVKILWLSALVARGTGMVTGAGRAVKLILQSRLVLAVSAIWVLTLYFESLYSPGELQKVSLFLTIGWLVATSALLAVVRRFFYTTALDQYAEAFGLETRDYLPAPEKGTEAGTETVLPGTVSLWWILLSWVPLLSIVAFVRGRSAARRLHWRSIRAVLAYSFGLFFTLVHLLVLIGASLPRSSDPEMDYSFLAQSDSSLARQANLLATGDFVQAHDALTKPGDKLAEASWPHLTALAIAHSHLGDGEQALADYEKASNLKPERMQFHYLYGRLLLEKGQRSKAEQQFLQARELGLKEEQSAPFLSLARSSYEPPRWVTIVWAVVILTLLFTVHEFAHAYSAFKLGDTTAAEQGRLTLNPIAHLDILGSVILPGLLLWRQSDILFGWAKPVPVTPEKFANPRRDHMLVSFAGPAANLIVMMGGAILLLVILVDVRMMSPDARSISLADPAASLSLTGSGLPAWTAPVLAFLKQFILTSLILACFNLIPMPPLDGSWILSGLVSEKSQAKLEAVRPYASIAFLVLVFTPVFDFLLAIPVGLLWAGGAACFALMGFS